MAVVCSVNDFAYSMAVVCSVNDIAYSMAVVCSVNDFAYSPFHMHDTKGPGYTQVAEKITLACFL